jgi:hypothetical protein
MKRVLVFLFLGPIGGSLVTMLFEVQFLLRLGAIFSPTSFGVAFFFGYIVGIPPALVLGFVDWPHHPRFGLSVPHGLLGNGHSI